MFRGAVMGLLEKKTNICVAVFLPSVLFGALHIIGNALDPLSVLQLIVSGTAVGVLFSLVAYCCGSFWSAALVHAVWNAATVGLMHIGVAPEPSTVYTYVLQSKARWITGGDFGVESSAISTLAYILFSVLVWAAIRRKGTGNKGDIP